MQRVFDKETIAKDEDEHNHGQLEEKRNQVGSELLQIRTLDQELSNPEQNPKNVFLNHCEEFAKINLDKDMLLIENYDLRLEDMVPVRSEKTQLEPVFAEYEPVDIEEAFKVKNEIGTKERVITTKGRMKEYPEETEGNLTQVLLASFAQKQGQSSTK